MLFMSIIVYPSAGCNVWCPACYAAIMVTLIVAWFAQKSLVHPNNADVDMLNMLDVT